MRAPVAPPPASVPAPHHLQVGPVQVSLWWARLDASPPQLERWRHSLAVDERAESERYRRGRDAFVAGRGLLRHILGGHLGVEPAGLRFGRSAQGKPFLRDLDGAPEFSASRSGVWMGVALAARGAVGLDLERRRHDVDCVAVAEHLFAPRERAAVAALSPAAERRAFFSCWVRKEACLKAIGTGLALPPERLEVGVTALARVSCQGRIWLVRNVMPPHQGYVAAVAVESSTGEEEERWPNSSR